MMQSKEDDYDEDEIEDSATDIPETAEVVPNMNFRVLHDPRTNIQGLIDELRANAEYRGYISFLNLEDIEVNLLNQEMWSEFTEEIVHQVRGSLAKTQSNLSNCKKFLFLQEEKAMRSWAMKHSTAGTVCKSGFDLFAFLTTVAEIFVSILHRYMCNGLSGRAVKISDELTRIFGSDSDPNESFDPGLQETMYYISGWIVCAARKESKRRSEEMKIGLELLVKRASLPKTEGKVDKSLPMSVKVEKTERFGGLVYASNNFYMFVLQLELAFKRFLLPEYLVVYGCTIVGTLYNAMKNCAEMQDQMKLLIIGTDEALLEREVSDETIRHVSDYVARTYCRMRGKDYVRKLLSQSANQVNSQKPIRQVLAVKTGEVKKGNHKNGSLQDGQGGTSNDAAMESILEQLE